ncbi:MAG TPA: 2-octaprenyl-6-methoxyphenyl hydroxylase [Steroidobacteraceae bacterium]
MTPPPPVDVAIVGGGMVGASLAVALAPLGLKVALIEALAHDSAAQPSFDERTTALSNGSCRILESLGVWSGVMAQATPIRKIHVSDQGHFGFARIDAAEQDLAAMGYVVPNRALGAALWSLLKADGNVQLYCPAQVTRVAAGEEGVALEIARGDVSSAIDARLVVAADGVQSAVRSAFGVDAFARDYQQTAVITTVLPQRFHEHVAYERFTASGPLALLPLAGGRCTLVLTLDNETAKAAMAWSDDEFIAEVQRRFGFRLGRFLKVGRRVPYALALNYAERTSARRCVIIGNAAQGLHPVAGMGFNLGLRDVASLAELIAERRHEPHFDAGSPGLLADYDAWRRADRRGVIAFTDGLVRMFASPFGPVKRLRNLGLLAFDLLPPAKAALSRLSTGAGGGARVPKLARGVALR